MYTIRYTEDAKNDLLRLQRNEPKAFAKVSRFIQELAEHPKTGTGHPEPLKGQPQGRGRFSDHFRKTVAATMFVR